MDILERAEKLTACLFQKIQKIQKYEDEYEDTNVYEIILFDSVARQEKYPIDIDLIIIDGGYFSSHCPFIAYGYGDIAHNFEWLINDLHISYAAEKIIGNIKVHIQFLRLDFLIDKKYRKTVKKRQRD